MSAVACVNEGHAKNADEIREYLAEHPEVSALVLGLVFSIPGALFRLARPAAGGQGAGHLAGHVQLAGGGERLAAQGQRGSREPCRLKQPSLGASSTSFTRIWPKATTTAASGALESAK